MLDAAMPFNAGGSVTRQCLGGAAATSANLRWDSVAKFSFATKSIDR